MDDWMQLASRGELPPGMRHADLLAASTSAPNSPPARAPDLVSLGTALVDGSDARGAGRAAVKEGRFLAQSSARHN